MAKQHARIMLSGGGTGGSVVPLLVLAKELKQRHQHDYQFLFVGTKYGMEKQLVEGIDFVSIPAGKLRRYFSFKNIIDIFLIIAGFFKSIVITIKFKPDIFISAGSFVSVPTAYAAKLFGVKILIHQQDVRPGLANRLMALVADKITMVFKKSFGGQGIVVGNPYGSIKLIAKPLLPKPLLLVIGGGTGSEFLNNLIVQVLPELIINWTIIHIGGKREAKNIINDDYHYYEFVNHAELLEMMQSATVILSRCGMGVLTEICALKKTAILVPMPKSHQEDNAQIFSEQKAAIILAQEELAKAPQGLVSKLTELLANPQSRQVLENNIARVIPRGDEKLIQIIEELIG